jgi:hypothetical protein
MTALANIGYRNFELVSFLAVITFYQKRRANVGGVLSHTHAQRGQETCLNSVAANLFVSRVSLQD